MTRKMYKEAGLPALPARFPADAPKISTRTPCINSRPSPQPKKKSEPVARSRLSIAPPPTALASPARFDAPSPLSSCPSSPSERSSVSSTYFTATSSFTQMDDSHPSVCVHPGVRWVQRKAEDRWAFIRDGQTVRMCMPPKDVPEPVSPPAPLKNMSVDQEWDRLGTPGPSTHVGASGGNERANQRSSIERSRHAHTPTGSPFPEQLQKA